MFNIFTALYVVGGIALGGVLGYGYGTSVGWDRGYSAAVAAVEAQDAKAASVAKEKRNDVAACYDADGTWDTTRGVCDRKQ